MRFRIYSVLLCMGLCVFSIARGQQAWAVNCQEDEANDPRPERTPEEQQLVQRLREIIRSWRQHLRGDSRIAMELLKGHELLNRDEIHELGRFLRDMARVGRPEIQAIANKILGKEEPKPLSKFSDPKAERKRMMRALGPRAAYKECYRNGAAMGKRFSALDLRQNLWESFSQLDEQEQERVVGQTLAMLTVGGITAYTFSAAFRACASRAITRIAAMASDAAVAGAVEGGGVILSGLVAGLIVYFYSSPTNAQETYDFFLTPKGVLFWSGLQRDIDADFYLGMLPDLDIYFSALGEAMLPSSGYP